ncbi:aromatic prenyltransferase [Colletotrichum sublineola]|nr:aromatic prenyltransferase [Colletotrichum sublineola]
MEIYRLNDVRDDHSGTVTKNPTYNEAIDPSTSSSKGSPRPLVSSWLPIIHNSLSSLLRWAGPYPAEVQESHLAFMRDVVVPCLKPPAAADRLSYVANHNHSTYEASLAFSSYRPPKVRYSVQPLVDPSPGDPLGQKALRNILEGIASKCGADRKWLDAFIDSSFLTTEEQAALVSKGAVAAASDASHPLPQSALVAFDLHVNTDKGGKAANTMKTYLFPQYKALITGQKTVDTTDSIVRVLAEGNQEMLAAWELIKTFLNTNSGKKVMLDFLAIDCLAPSKEARSKRPRLKIYFSTNFKSLAAVREVVTLGGLLPRSSANMDFLSEAWPLLMDMEDIPQAEIEDLEKPLNDPTSHYQGVGFTIAVAPGEAIPQIKTCVPIWQFARDEARIIACCQRLSQKHGPTGKFNFGAAIQDAL